MRDELREAVRHQGRSSWTESGSALQRAKIRLGKRGNAEVLALLDLAERDQRSAMALEAARYKNAVRLRVRDVDLEAEYEAAFRGSVLGEIGGEPGPAAARIRTSNIRQALVDGLDEWASFAASRPEAGRLSWLLAVAREADPDPTGWRDRFRDPRVWRDHAALKKLSDEADLARLSVPLVLALGDRIRGVRGDLIALLERAVRQHPDDLLINTYLARALEEDGHSSEAIRYYQAAVALRPDVSWVHQNIGVSLMSLGRFDEAIASYREAIRLRPRGPPPLPVPRLRPRPDGPDRRGLRLVSEGDGDARPLAGDRVLVATPRHPGGPGGRGPTRMAEEPRRAALRPRRLGRLRRALPLPRRAGRIPQGPEACSSRTSSPAGSPATPSASAGPACSCRALRRR